MSRVSEQHEQVIDSSIGNVARHIRDYVESGGAKGHTFYGRDSLLLTTRGRKTGLLRRSALFYGRDGDRFLVVASNGGSVYHPLWYLNLLEEPLVEVQVCPEIFSARARPATEDEKPALWEKMVRIFSTYETYRRKTKRDIPVVILERVKASE